MKQARSMYRSIPILTSLVCLLLLPTLSFAKSSSPEPVGHLSASASAVQWMPAGDNERIVLTVVAPNGAVFHKEFTAGTAPSFRLQDLGGRLTDGPYTYELRVVPHITAEVKKQLADARAAGDDDAAGRIQATAGINPNGLVQSGSLLVLNGAFVSPDLEEPRSAAPVSGPSALSVPKIIKPLDVVVADDQIVQGSQCVGLDCVVNESFGFDTVKLKENNTRIHFDDTSTSTGFPNHNWQLTANDSNSGGANKFSIEDLTSATVPFTITGSSPSNSIFVDSTGRLGLRTATPVLDVHIATGNTPAFRQEQNTSGGFTAQTWDIGGNEANWFVRDVTGGSRLPLRIRPGAPTSSIDIAATGNVGVGTASPSELLHLNGNGNPRVFVVSNNSGTAGINMQVTNSGTSTGFSIVRTESNGDQTFFTGTSGGAVTEHVRVTVGGNVGINCNAPTFAFMIGSGSGCSTPTSGVNPGSTSFTVASSRTFKENIAPIDVPDILNKIEAVPVVTYDFKNNGPKDRLGLIAEDFHQVFDRGSDKYIDGQDVQMALWMAVQKLTAENKALTERLSKLEGALAQQKPKN
ncbi:MAG TPA: tail fiber domain-containing protein [Thermoanaerobaculia bacterium]|nr:tail fiber domain-containing protein [Thermoanaerobaculia bacterium]